MNSGNGSRALPPKACVARRPVQALLASMLLALALTGAVRAQGAASDAAAPPRTPAPKDASVYIGFPNDGMVVRSTRVKVWFGTRNFGVSPAGYDLPNTGHHHLIVDAPLPPLDEPIPNDKNHLHFGRGQTETVLELPPGRHTLQLLMGNGEHIPHDPPLVSKQISILVRP